jgi:hypothetical protein
LTGINVISVSQQVDAFKLHRSESKQHARARQARKRSLLCKRQSVDEATATKNASALWPLCLLSLSARFGSFLLQPLMPRARASFLSFSAPVVLPCEAVQTVHLIKLNEQFGRLQIG